MDIIRIGSAYWIIFSRALSQNNLLLFHSHLRGDTALHEVLQSPDKLLHLFAALLAVHRKHN
jgi:hypothetical protein